MKSHFSMRHTAHCVKRTVVCDTVRLTPRARELATQKNHWALTFAKAHSYLTHTLLRYITFSHLADAFIQSNVQGREQSS